MRLPSRLGYQEQISRPRSKTGDDALSGELAKILCIKLAWEVDEAGAELGQLEAGVDRILRGIDTNDE